MARSPEPHPQPRRALRILDADGREDGLYLAPRLQNNDAKASVLDPNAMLDFIGGPSGRPFYNADKNNFAPNVGFAWDPFKTGQDLDPRRLLDLVCERQHGHHVPQRRQPELRPGVREHIVEPDGAVLPAPPVVSAPAYKVPRTLADNFAITDDQLYRASWIRT